MSVSFKNPLWANKVWKFHRSLLHGTVGLDHGIDMSDIDDAVDLVFRYIIMNSVEDSYIQWMSEAKDMLDGIGHINPDAVIAEFADVFEAAMDAADKEGETS